MASAVFRILRQREVCALTGLSRTTIWRMVRAGSFPKPMMISERTPGWAEPDVARYQQERRAAAGLPELIDAA
jgi:prophage regulatory protein